MDDSTNFQQSILDNLFIIDAFLNNDTKLTQSEIKIIISILSLFLAETANDICMQIEKDGINQFYIDKNSPVSYVLFHEIKDEYETIANKLLAMQPMGKVKSSLEAMIIGVAKHLDTFITEKIEE